MTDLILKSFNGVAQHKSYGGKTLQQNLENADKAIAKVRYTERIWDRSRSQWMLKFLTCSNADGWLRLRQISAEMCRKRKALSEAKFGYLKKLTEAKIKRDEMVEEENENKRLLLEIEAAEFENISSEVLIKIEGALKEVETLAQMHDQLKERLGDITEEEFEKVQTKAHIKRAVMQATREVKECGKIVIVEEGNKIGGWGSEVASIIQEKAFHELKYPVQRIGAMDIPIPSSGPMEIEMLPSAKHVIEIINERF